MVAVLERAVEVEVEQHRRRGKLHPRLLARLAHDRLARGLAWLHTAARQGKPRQVAVTNQQHLAPIVQRQKPHAKAHRCPQPRRRPYGKPPQPQMQPPCKP
jgi:hypothetical protein